MGPFIITPADMQPHFVFGNIDQCVVQRFDMAGGNFDKFGVAEIGEQHVP